MIRNIAALTTILLMSAGASAQDPKAELSRLLRLSALSDVCPLTTTAAEERDLEEEIDGIAEQLKLKEAEVEAMFQAARKAVEADKARLCAAEGPAALAAIKSIATD